LAEFLHSASTAALTSTQLANEPGKPWPVSNLKTLRRHTLADPSASRTLPSWKNEMGNLHLDFGKLDVLMRVVGFVVGKFGIAAHTQLGGTGTTLVGARSDC